MNRLSRFASLPIRTQLILLAILLTLPALGIIIYSGLKVRTEDYRSASIDTQRLVANVAAEVQGLVHESERLGAILADLPDIRERNVAKTEALLAATIKRYPYYNALIVADAAGTIWASTTTPRSDNASIAHRRYFESARTTRRFSSGEFVLSRERGIPTIHVAYPLGSPERFEGAIIIGFKLDMLREVLERANLSSHANYIVTDRRGIIITRGRNLGMEVSKPIQQPDLKKMEQGPDSGTYEFTRVDGERRIVSYQKVRLEGEREPFVYVRGGVSITDAVARANRHLLINVLLMLSFVVLSFVLTLMIGKRSIVDRIAVLKKASQDLAGGELTFTVSNRLSGGELGDLAQTFDDMARQLTLREQALRESEQNYRDIFNTIQDAVIINDESGLVVNHNSAAEAMFGYTHQEFIGRSIKDLMTGTPPYSFEEARKMIGETLKGTPQRFEWLCKKRNGEPFWTEIIISATQIAGNKRVLALVRDISSQKEIERFKEEMISNVTHEMRTPLTAILGFLEFVKDNPVEESQLKECLDIMRKEAERLDGMVGTFLDMQALKANKEVYRFQPLQVLPLVHDAVALFTSPPHQDRVLTEVPADLPPICGDETFLHRALVNLLSNAVKYSPPDSAVTIRARRDRDGVVLSVSDQGVGISEEALPKVFEAFYRVKSTAQRPGTGLGLAFVREIARAHNGRVWVESTLGQGSTFHLLLPTAEERQVNEAPSAPAPLDSRE